jgi:aminobenzoyl-glutamate transport protein
MALKVGTQVTFLQRYLQRAGIGTLVSVMLPYSVTFLVGWSALLVAWMLLGWPFGPGAPTSLPSGTALP